MKGFNEIYKCWEDADLNIRIANEKPFFYLIDKTIAYSQRHNNGVSANQERCFECRFYFLKNYLDILPKDYINDIIYELNKCAISFNLSKRYEILSEAVKLAKLHSYKLPFSNNRFLNFLHYININYKYIYMIQTFRQE